MCCTELSLAATSATAAVLSSAQLSSVPLSTSAASSLLLTLSTVRQQTSTTSHLQTIASLVDGIAGSVGTGLVLGSPPAVLQTPTLQVLSKDQCISNCTAATIFLSHSLSARSPCTEPLGPLSALQPFRHPTVPARACQPMQVCCP